MELKVNFKIYDRLLIFLTFIIILSYFQFQPSIIFLSSLGFLCMFSVNKTVIITWTPLIELLISSYNVKLVFYNWFLFLKKFHALFKILSIFAMFSNIFGSIESLIFSFIFNNCNFHCFINVLIIISRKVSMTFWTM